jgi:hypothetical protein
VQEQALLAYRGDIPFPKPLPEAEPPISAEAAVALKFL